MSFIVIEGLDGSGKSTQIRMLRSYLEEQGIAHYFIHFPRTDTGFFGEMISRFLRGEFGDLEDVDPYFVAMIYAGDRKEAAPQLKTAMNKGHLVLADRYVFSNIAYQCAKLKKSKERDLLENWILNLEYHHFSIPKPDLNLFLDVPMHFTRERLSHQRKGEERTYLQGSEDIHEKSLSFQETVANVYSGLVKKGLATSLPCSDDEGLMLPKEIIFDRMIAILHSNNIL